MITKAAWKWVACGWYLFFFASEVCIGPFINVYLRSKGLSEQQIGLISAMRPWLAVIASFLWSLAADYFKAHRFLMVALLLASGAVRIPLPWLSSFSAFFVFIIINSCLGSPVTIMADAAVTGSCTEDGEYGRYRLYGAIGWGGMSTVAGIVADAYGIRASLLLYLLLMLPCAALSWFLWGPPQAQQQQVDASKKAELIRARKASFKQIDEDVTELEMTSMDGSHGGRHVHAAHEGTDSWRGDSGGPCRGDRQQQQQHRGAGGAEPSFAVKLGRIFSRGESLVFFWTALVMGFGMGMIDGYLFLLLKDMGASDMLLGLTLTITCLAEAPIFQLLGLMLKVLGSADALMDISLAAYTLRMMCYAALPLLRSPWWVLPLELLHGLTFGCGWGAGCEKSKALAPPGLEATQQGIFQSLYFGLGTGLGSLVGGFLAQAHGFQRMFFIGALMVALGWLLSMLGRVVLRAQAGGSYSAVGVEDDSLT